MTLGKKQRLFARLQAEFVLWVYSQGYELSDGEAWRPPEMALIYAHQKKGIVRSVHEDRLAKDWNLFKNGIWLKKTEDHAPLGKKWKSMHALCRWGGDFPAGDGNHYSFEHQGRC